jgi:hypothetical protein
MHLLEEEKIHYETDLNKRVNGFDGHGMYQVPCNKYSIAGLVTELHLTINMEDDFSLTT